MPGSAGMSAAISTSSEISSASVLTVGVFGFASPAAPASAREGDQVSFSTQPTLYPAFSTRIHNYVTRCANIPVQVAVTGARGAWVSVDGGRARAGDYTTAVSLAEGEAFDIATWSDNSSSTYQVRCLPSDFPVWTAQRSGQTQASFYVVTPTLNINPSSPTPAPYVVVFDNNGVPRWWMKSSPEPVDAKALSNGDLAWTHAFQGTAPQEYRLDGSLVRSFPASAAPQSDGIDFHELQVLPNGNYLLAIDRSIPYDLSPCGGPTKGSLYDQQIQELTANGSLVWSWDAADHISLSEVDPSWRANCAAGDAYHFNSIEPVGNDIIVSFRHLDAVYRISTTTSAIEWKLGGTPRPESLTIRDDPVFDAGSGFGGQHDARLLADGTLTLHDNGTNRAGSPRAVQYRLDTSSHTATLIEQVSDPAVTSSGCCGSARMLPGGDWVVSWGANSVVEELSHSGRRVFSIDFANNAFSYRADPVSSRNWGPALDSGMSAQYPRPSRTRERPTGSAQGTDRAFHNRD
jgi:hypothetical protein